MNITREAIPLYTDIQRTARSEFRADARAPMERVELPTAPGEGESESMSWLDTSPFWISVAIVVCVVVALNYLELIP
jgi:hypothetical protein